MRHYLGPLFPPRLWFWPHVLRYPFQAGPFASCSRGSPWAAAAKNLGLGRGKGM